ncbi:MAG: glutamine--fructose-6-phosphate transaminase (isomerizing) [Cellulosilyticaceae bacterium]
MCGIVGYVGYRNASEVVLGGLEKLEYRGYDSAGIAMIDVSKTLQCVKKQGRLRVLEDTLQEQPLEGSIAIGHTRWATHGGPSDTNAHPHLNEEQTIAVVHNGIIENYQALKEQLVEAGYKFVSQTDTEVIAHLIDACYKGDLLKAVYEAKQKLRGSYALGIISSRHPNELIAVRKESPLIVGIGEGEYFVASDIPAILEYTKQVCYLDQDEVVHIKNNKLMVYDRDHKQVTKSVQTIEWGVEAASKNGYDHFMLKEIFDQPQAIKETLIRRLGEDGMIGLDGVKMDRQALEDIHKIYIVACGTAFHAGVIGKYVIEKLAKIPVETDIASEFRYSDPFVDAHTLLIVVSQSGETADTLAAMKEAKRKGARILAITNVVGSSVARDADDVLYTWAGPEIAVASTKAYTAQLVAFYMLALHFARIKQTIDSETYKDYIAQILNLSDSVEEVLSHKEAIEEVAMSLEHTTSAFYLGRGLDYLTAREGALKLKEISYIHTEAFAAGELKHGTIALIEQDVPVIAMITQSLLADKMISNIQEVKARGAKVIAIAPKGISNLEKEVDAWIEIPSVNDLLMPILSVVPTQLLAYYTSCIRGNDVDKPRNLAKSVTVE